MTLNYPNCPVCKAIKEQTKASDQQINAYHESKGSYEVFDKRDRDTVIEIVLKVERQKLFEMIQKVADELYGWVMSENEISEFLHILDEAHIRRQIDLDLPSNRGYLRTSR